MASLVKDCRDRSPYWTACYRDADGRRLKISTKERDKKKAQIIADAWEEAEDLGRGGNLTWAHFRRILTSTYERVNKTKVFDPTVRDWFTQWLNNEKETIVASTYARYCQTARQFIDHLGHRADRRLESVTSADVTAFRDALSLEGRAPATVNGLVVSLNRPFSLALERGLIQFNPVTSVKHLKSSKVEKGTFTLEQVTALFDTAKGDWKGMVLLGLYTGARISDLARLRWSNFDFDDLKTLTFQQGKTEKFVTIPMHAELEQYLRSLPGRDNTDALLFPALCKIRKNGNDRASSDLSDAFMALMAATGIKPGVGRESKGGVGRTTSRLSFHSLRHTFNSLLANAGVAQENRQKLTGHSSAAMNTHYTHTELRVLRGAVDLVPGLLSQVSKQEAVVEFAAV